MNFVGFQTFSRNTIAFSEFYGSRETHVPKNRSVSFVMLFR